MTLVWFVERQAQSRDHTEHPCIGAFKPVLPWIWGSLAGLGRASSPP